MTIIIIGFRIACAAFEWTLMRLYITLSIDLSDRKYGPLQGNRFSPILPYSWYLQCCSSEQWSMWNASAYCSTWNNGTWFRIQAEWIRIQGSHHQQRDLKPCAQRSSTARPRLQHRAPLPCERSERGKRAERAATNRETRHPWGFRFS